MRIATKSRYVQIDLKLPVRLSDAVEAAAKLGEVPIQEWLEAAVDAALASYRCRHGAPRPEPVAQESA